jgi:hypothetical protein
MIDNAFYLQTDAKREGDLGGDSEHADLPVLEAGLLDWGACFVNPGGPLTMLGMLLAVETDPEVAVAHEDLWLRAFLRALHQGTCEMGLPSISLDEIRMRYRLTSVGNVIGSMGNLTQLYNMFPRNRFKEIKGVDDRLIQEQYILRVYCMAPLYAFRHWEQRGLYRVVKEWERQHPG